MAGRSPCAACGQALPAGARFCPACGAAVAASLGEERKVVSVLFADVVDSTARAERLDPEDVRALLVPYWQRARAEIERFGGTLEKYIGDAVMAVFGAPTAHEDDPERAVRAALAIREAVGRLNAERPGSELELRIGVHTGQAVVARGARPLEGEGIASGDVLNAAARLQTAADPGDILVGAATYRATADAIEYEHVGRVAAKGKPAGIAAWRALGTRAEARDRRPRTPLVGRVHELELLLDTLVRVRREREPQLVTLVGVPGIGKSRLVAELMAAVDGAGEAVTFRYGRSLPYGDGGAFTALADVVKAEAGVLATDEADVAARKLREAVAAVAPAEEAAWIERHLRPLVGLGRRGDPEREEAFAAWRRFLESLVDGRTLVVVLEDLHWAGDELLDFVDYLLDWASAAPLLVLCTARPELLERRPSWGGGKRNAATAALRPLSEPQTAELLRALLDDLSPGSARTAQLVAASGGNPLYAEEFARMVRDRGLAGAEGRLPLPETVQGIVAARIDALPEPQRAVLLDAAVIGKAFWAGAVEALAGARSPGIGAALNALERKEFVRRERRSSVAGELEYSFRHALVRDVAYGALPRARRAEKHRRSAEWIGALARGREDQAELLAHHWLNALEYARAAGSALAGAEAHARRALRDAGARARALGTPAAAAGYFRQALELWPADDPDRLPLLLELGTALFEAHEEGEAELEEARAGLEASGRPGAAARAEVVLSRLRTAGRRRDEAARHLERAWALVASLPPSPEKALVLVARAGFLMTDDDAGAPAAAEEALAMVEALGLDELRVQALTVRGTSRVLAGDAEGLRDLEESIALARRLDSPEAVRGYLNLGSMIANVGDLPRAFELYREGRALAERLGSAGAIRWFAVERLYEHFWTGAWDDALELAGRLLDEVGPDGSHFMEIDARLVRAKVALERLGPAAAADEADRAVEAARAAGHPQMLFPALAFAARVAAEAGELPLAAERSEELIAHWDTAGATLSIWVPDLAIAVGGTDGEQVLAAIGRVETSTRWLEAAAALLTADYPAAAACFAAIGAGPEEAYARLRAAEAAAVRGEPTQPILVPALAFLERARAEARLEGARALAG